MQDLSSTDVDQLVEELGSNLLIEYCKLVKQKQPEFKSKISKGSLERLAEIRLDLIEKGWASKEAKNSNKFGSTRRLITRKHGRDFLNSIFTLVNHPLIGTPEHEAYGILPELIQLRDMLLESSKLQSRYVLRNFQYGPWPEGKVFTTGWLSSIVSGIKIDTTPSAKSIPKILSAGNGQAIIEALDNMNIENEHSILDKLEILSKWTEYRISTIGVFFLSVFNQAPEEFMKRLAVSIVNYCNEYAKTLPGHVFGRRIRRPKDIFSRPGEYGGGRYGGQYYDDDW